LGCKPLAKIVSHAVHAQEPNWFATAPVGAVKKALAKAGWAVKDVDLWEINEAFAVVPMALMTELAIPHDIVNVNGGACALGHPIGASGARIMVTLIHALKARGLSKGLATLCIGGGEATAVALELL
jgi:acetyl-CoA C-acetyltransferase